MKQNSVYLHQRNKLEITRLIFCMMISIHKAKTITQWFEEMKVAKFNQPVQSPDYYSSEHLQNQLKFWLRTKPNHPQNTAVYCVEGGLGPNFFRHHPVHIGKSSLKYRACNSNKWWNYQSLMAAQHTNNIQINFISIQLRFANTILLRDHTYFCRGYFSEFLCLRNEKYFFSFLSEHGNYQLNDLFYLWFKFNCAIINVLTFQLLM